MAPPRQRKPSRRRRAAIHGSVLRPPIGRATVTAGTIGETAMQDIVILDGARTAIGTFGGSLKDIAAPDLGAAAIRAAVDRAGLEPHEIGTAVMGQVVQAGAKMNPARQAAVRGGLPVAVPALTVNRVCGSGAQAIVSAAQEIALGSGAARLAVIPAGESPANRGVQSLL